MDNRIYCLMTGGMYLTDEIRDLLHLTAIEMARGKERTRPIRGEDFVGEIRTDFQYQSAGMMDGYAFEAVIDRGTRRSTIRYLVRTTFLDGLDESVWVLVPLRRPAATHLN